MTWQSRAACVEADPALFFTPDYPEAKEQREARISSALVFCAQCEVRAECLEYAHSHHQHAGIWGGRELR